MTLWKIFKAHFSVLIILILAEDTNSSVVYRIGTVSAAIAHYDIHIIALICNITQDLLNIVVGDGSRHIFLFEILGEKTWNFSSFFTTKILIIWYIADVVIPFWKMNKSE